MKMKRLGAPDPVRGVPKAPNDVGSARTPAPRADCLRKCLLLFMSVLKGLFWLSVNEGIGGQKREDDGVEATTTFDISEIGVDQGF